MTPCGSYKNRAQRLELSNLSLSSLPIEEYYVRFEVLIRATRRHLPEDDNHHSHRRGNLKSYKIFDRLF
jgi:hypothetical protein